MILIILQQLSVAILKNQEPLPVPPVHLKEPWLHGRAADALVLNCLVLENLATYHGRGLLSFDELLVKIC